MTAPWRIGAAAGLATGVVLLALALRPDASPADPLALVEMWAGETPIAGLRCSAIALDELHIATARHCVSGSTRTMLIGGSLCEVQSRVLAVVEPLEEPVESTAPNGLDAVVLVIDARLVTTPVRRGDPHAGRARVTAFGVTPGLGRPACGPMAYDAVMGNCGQPFADGTWCLHAAAEQQICGGSSGAPVFLHDESGWSLVAVVSGGPHCGREGPVVVAPLPPSLE